tara:strand:- start:4033 stop:6822 length:2790 start_codon:yes stop_codon:yes gene_type:complete
MADKSYKHYFRLINADVVGPIQRQNNPDGFHPMLRQDWGMRDGIRAVLGNYYTVYESTKGETLWSYPDPGNATDQSSMNLGRLENQTANIVLKISNKTQISEDPIADQMSPIINITPARSTATPPRYMWNYYAEQGPASALWLNVVIPGIGPWDWVGALIKRQNLYNYVASEVPFDVENKTYNSLISGITSTSSPIEDYTCVSWSISGDKAHRDAIGTSLAVHPQYNYYVDTVPSYEQVISSPSVSEAFLPNIYLMQAEAKNTTNNLLAEFHGFILTLGGVIPYFDSIPGATPGMTEQAVSGTYAMLAQVLSAGEAPSAQQDQAAEQNRKFVILSSDEGVLQADYIDASRTPFSNKIVIPQDPQERTGHVRDNSFFGSLAVYETSGQSKPGRDFLDILQILCINTLEAYKSPSPSAGTYRVTTRKVLSSTDASDYIFETAQTPYTYLANVGLAIETFMAASVATAPNTPIGQAEAIINAYSVPSTITPEPPYRLIRDYSRCISTDDLDQGAGFTGGPLSAIQLDPGCIQIAQDFLDNNLEGYLRTYLQILDGVQCHTETLMYVVSKYEVQSSDDSDGPLVQKFYITNRFAPETMGTPITFYDSQVKYEKRYRYKIDKMVAIFGNAYDYESLASETAPPLEVPIQVTNAGNIKIVLLPYVFGTTPAKSGLESIIIDNPPVTPEMSFYAHRGINNQLQILFNSNTGVYDVSPVAILDSDAAFFETEYASQNQEQLSFDQIKEQDKTLHFRSDDPVDKYQLFRTTIPPTNYGSFSDREVFSSNLDPVYGTAASYVDSIVPNTKYYYCSRAVDVHGNISNPTPIIEVEMVDNDGQIFLRQKPYTFKTIKQPLTMSGRKYILIEPSGRQVEFRAQAQTAPNTVNDTPSVPLGEDGIEDSIWNKAFKVRLISKKTGRKMDLNINFKNSGIVKGSE